MIEVREARPAELVWIEGKTSCVLTRDARGLVALDGDKKVGMVAYDHWTDSTVWMHMAFSPPALRRLLVPMWDYPFRWAKKRLVVGFIAASNSRSVALARSMGAVETHRVHDGQAVGDDWILFEMRREHCRFGGPYG